MHSGKMKMLRVKKMWTFFADIKGKRFKMIQKRVKILKMQRFKF